MISQITLPRPDEADDEVTVIHFGGAKVSLDEDTIERIRDTLFALADEAGLSPLVLDFRNVAYVSSMTLGTLVTLHKKLRADGRRLTIQNLTPPVFEIFAVTRLDEYLDLRRIDRAAGPAGDGRRPETSRSILVVDDEPAVLAVVAAGLHREGCSVWLAANGQQAIELYRRRGREIAVVLSDVHMPDSDGPHTLLALQEMFPAVRCCFMTGNIWPYSEKALLQMGAVRVFHKPFVLTEVLDTIRQLLSPFPQNRRDHWIEIPVAHRACELS